MDFTIEVTGKKIYACQQKISIEKWEKMTINHAVSNIFRKSGIEGEVFNTTSKIVVQWVLKIYLLAYFEVSSSLSYCPLLKFF